MNEKSPTAQEIMGENFIIGGPRRAEARRRRAKQIKRTKRAAGGVSALSIVAACASFMDSSTEGSLSALSTTTTTESPRLTTTSTLPETTSTLVVETSVPRVFNCNGDNVVQDNDTLFKMVKFCNAQGGNFTVEGLAAANAIADASVIYTGQHITTVTTQPPVTEVPTTLATLPETTLPSETLPPDTLAPETTVAVPVNDGTYSKADCENMGGTPVEFAAGAGGPWEVIYNFYEGHGITLYQVGRVMKSPLPAEFKINNITASSPEYPTSECMPPLKAILEVAPLAAPPA